MLKYNTTYNMGYWNNICLNVIRYMLEGKHFKIINILGNMLYADL